MPLSPDLVEGKVSKGIYLREPKGVTLLYYGRYKASCISNPAQCGPEGERAAVFVCLFLKMSVWMSDREGEGVGEKHR